MKLSTLVYEVVLLVLVSRSESAEPAKTESAANSQAPKPAAQTAPATPASPATPATPATPVNPAGGQTANLTVRPVTAASASTSHLDTQATALNVTKQVELDISKRNGTNDYSYRALSDGVTSKFVAYYGAVFAKVKDGDFVLWDGKGTVSSLLVELTSDFRVSVTLQNGKKLMFVKGYKCWHEYDPKQVEVANYVDASGFSMGWEVHETPAEPGKKEGEEDSKEGSKSGKSGRKVPVWGISLMAVSGTVLVVSIGVAIGIRMRK